MLKRTALKEKRDHEIYTELQNKTMPELWKEAVILGISKKGKKSQLIERIMESQMKKQKDPENAIIDNALEQLKDELKEFDKIKEVMRIKVDSTFKIVPKLKDRKKLLEKNIQENREKIDEIDNLIPDLQEERDNIQVDKAQAEGEKELLEKDIEENQRKLVEISELVPKLVNKRKKQGQIVEQKFSEISKIEEQIKQILTIQEYSVDLLSTLMYTSEQ